MYHNCDCNGFCLIFWHVWMRFCKPRFTYATGAHTHIHTEQTYIRARAHIHAHRRQTHMYALHTQR